MGLMLRQDFVKAFGRAFAGALKLEPGQYWVLELANYCLKALGLAGKLAVEGLRFDLE